VQNIYIPSNERSHYNPTSTIPSPKYALMSKKKHHSLQIQNTIVLLPLPDLFFILAIMVFLDKYCYEAGLYSKKEKDKHCSLWRNQTVTFVGLT
jgi:hypothetical protein